MNRQGNDYLAMPGNAKRNSSVIQIANCITMKIYKHGIVVNTRNQVQRISP